MLNNENVVAKKMANAVAFMCLKKSLKKKHFNGTLPETVQGDFSDVFIIDANGGKFGWTDCCRLSSQELEELCSDVATGIYEFLVEVQRGEYAASLEEAYQITSTWKDPMHLRKIPAVS